MLSKREMKKRTKEEKEKILLEINRLGVVAGCRRCGIDPRTYYNWLEKYQAHGLAGLEDGRGRKSEATLRRLEKENKVLKELLAEKELELKMKDELLKKRMVHWERAKK